MARQTLPDDRLAEAPTHKTCPDCYAEKRDPYILPISQFYIRNVPNSRYKGGVRISAYCIEHENKRRAEGRRRQVEAWQEEERATGVTPPGLAKYRKLGRDWKRTPKARAAGRQRQATLYAANPEKQKEANRRYLAKPDKAEARKKYAAEWYQRRGKQLAEARKRGAPHTLGKSLRKRRDAATEAAKEQPKT
jgi:hypothetical protein